MSRWLFIEPGRIGDWVVATVAVRLFMEKTGVEVDWAVRGEVLPLLDMALPFGDAVIIPDGVGLKVLPGLVSGVLGNRKEYDGCCVLSQGRSGALVASLTKAKIKCGYLGLLDPYNKTTPSGDLDLNGSEFKYDPSCEHLLVRTLRPLADMVPPFKYGEMSGYSDFNPCLLPSEDDEAKVQSLLSDVGVNAEKYVILSAGSRWRYKEWPLARWKDLAVDLCGKGIRVLAAGGPSEYDALRALEQSVASSLFNVVGPLKLSVYAALIKHSSVLVCHDSGPMHIASALGSNVVAIYGPTDPLVTGPLIDLDKVRIIRAKEDVGCCPCLVPSEDPHKGKICESGGHECMNNIRVDQVIAAVEEFIS